LPSAGLTIKNIHKKDLALFTAWLSLLPAAGRSVFLKDPVIRTAKFSLFDSPALDATKSPPTKSRPQKAANIGRTS